MTSHPNLAKLGPMFSYQRFVHFYETDSMGVVHHSNYIRFFEEGRVALMRDRGLMKEHLPHGELVFAVLETQCRHFKPVYFEDEVTVKTQARLNGIKIHFEYAIFTQRQPTPVADGMSLHILVDKNMKIRKPPAELKNTLMRELWIETLRSNL